MMRAPLLLVVALAAAASAACTEREGLDHTGAPTETAPPLSSANVPTNAGAPAPTAAAAPSTARRPVDAGAGGPSARACGAEPLPDCPLQAWMKAHATPPVLTNDAPALAAALAATAALAPPGYDHWASIARDGAAAARIGDFAAARASCRSCHDQYKDKYRLELRAREV